MAGKEQPSAVQQPMEAIHKSLLSRLIEVDHDVAAENEIEWPVEWPRFHQVQVSELNGIPHGINQLIDGFAPASVGSEVSTLERGRNRGGLRVLVDALAGLRQHVTGDVSGQDLDA